MRISTSAVAIALLPVTVLAVKPPAEGFSLEAAQKWLDYLPHDKDLNIQYQAGIKQMRGYKSKEVHNRIKYCPENIEDAKIQFYFMSGRMSLNKEVKRITDPSELEEVDYVFSINDDYCGAIVVSTTLKNGRYEPESLRYRDNNDHFYRIKSDPSFYSLTKAIDLKHNNIKFSPKEAFQLALEKDEGIKAGFEGMSLGHDRGNGPNGRVLRYSFDGVEGRGEYGKGNIEFRREIDVMAETGKVYVWPLLNHDDSDDYVEE